MALYDEALDRLTAVGQDLPPEQRLVAIIRAAAPMQKEVFPFASALNRTAPEHVLREIDRRFGQIIREPLSAAKRAGLVRPDLDADDIITLLTMIGGASVFRPDADEPRHRGKALRFVLESIVRHP
ncbi:hypothetical protein N1031_16385 [Herbiconiux moechotypicola]|uniref:SbtR family transcriptional regulator n=1 Tax=Herbiconiux moechotypicola TaxID=637393 RepID=UPI00217E9671|nr:hypothetical protein [Herbiconiux moechotypicola]MCS5731344.1 hypothetical protein [Herbiconiux moechotypicola]